ncbi:MAG: hypothetical protein AAFX02_03240 [Pseudomonadota bacterium]
MVGRKHILRYGLLGAISTGMLGGALASVEDNPRFEIMGIVIVWAADAAGNAPVVSDFVVSSGAGLGSHDLIAEDGFTVVTGTLGPAADAENGETFRILRSNRGSFRTDPNNDRLLTADDRFAAFSFNGAGNTDLTTPNRRSEIMSSFYVASNTAFSIEALATVPSGAPDPDALDKIRYRVRTTPNGTDGAVTFGSAAQFPHTGGSNGGVRNGFRFLNRIDTPTDVFTGNQATAASPGTILDQSVRFDVAYRYRTDDYDLSQGVVDSVATVTYTVYVP